MDRSRVGIIIPTLNESKTIAQIVKSVLPYGIAIVVDDGSIDNSGKLAIAAGAEVVQHGGLNNETMDSNRDAYVCHCGSRW